MAKTNPYGIEMPNSRWKDVGGQRFGKLTACHPTGKKYHGQHIWLCECDCGGFKEVPVGSLTSKSGTKSCGCDLYNNDRLITHGKSDTPMYERWRSMKRRCEDPTSKSYKYYGGKGVKVCGRWQDFNNFLADMGEPPTPAHEIDRKDANGDYEPDNCRWLTKAENVSRASRCRKAQNPC
ncbi:hypothetical protein ACXGWO_21180 [Salmonella enterica subsp. enterica serovar Infantis]|nr:hypothetical protein [Salmonella enterica]